MLKCKKKKVGLFKQNAAILGKPHMQSVRILRRINAKISGSYTFFSPALLLCVGPRRMFEIHFHPDQIKKLNLRICGWSQAVKWILRCMANRFQIHSLDSRG